IREIGILPALDVAPPPRKFAHAACQRTDRPPQVGHSLVLTQALREPFPTPLHSLLLIFGCADQLCEPPRPLLLFAFLIGESSGCAAGPDLSRSAPTRPKVRAASLPGPMSTD